MGTVCPSAILISFKTPADGEGISASTLSVEISNSGSSRSTLSPGFFSHLVMVPSKILSPIWGMTTSTAMGVISSHLVTVNSRLFAGVVQFVVQYVRNPDRSTQLVYRQRHSTESPTANKRGLPVIPVAALEARQFPRCGNHFFRVGQKSFLQRRRVRDRSIERGDPHQRSIQIVKRLFRKYGRDLPGDAARLGVFVNHQAFIGFFNRLQNGLFIEGQ